MSLRIYLNIITETGQSVPVFDYNITHNLNRMAKEAGLYEHLWRPDELSITEARQLIIPLSRGLAALKSDPERFKKLNPANSWGDYAGLVSFVEDYQQACERFPEARVGVSR